STVIGSEVAAAGLHDVNLKHESVDAESQSKRIDMFELSLGEGVGSERQTSAVSRSINIESRDPNSEVSFGREQGPDELQSGCAVIKERGTVVRVIKHD